MSGEISLSQHWDLLAELGGLYDAEQPIIARIQDQVPALRTVDSSSLIAGSQSFTDIMPAALVEPGEGTATDLGYGEISAQQTWSVLVLVPHHRKAPGDSSAARIAGPLALAVIRALHGWAPGDQFEPMLFSGHIDPVSSVGWAVFELRFTLGVTMTMTT